jgi:hypothetical protein
MDSPVYFSHFSGAEKRVAIVALFSSSKRCLGEVAFWIAWSRESGDWAWEKIVKISSRKDRLFRM